MAYAFLSLGRPRPDGNAYLDPCDYSNRRIAIYYNWKVKEYGLL
jgi:hypothetical protein